MSDEDLEAEENEFGSIDGSSPDTSFMPSLDMPSLNGASSSTGLGMPMQTGMQHLDFGHGMIQPQLLQQGM